MIKLIVAMDQNRLIGKNDSVNGMPWQDKEEMKHFRNTTLNHTLLMGETTYKAIGRPLPNRKTIVLSLEGFDDDHKEVEVNTSLDDVLNRYKDSDEVLFVSGGRSIYAQCLPYCDELLISRMKGTFTGETYFPEFESLGFKLVNSVEHETFTVETYRKD